MRAGALVAVLGLFALPAQAAPARVTSGEHGAFTRLVVAAGLPGDWALGRWEGGYEFRFPGLDDGYETAGVFDRLTGARLAGLQPGPRADALRIVLACDCHIAPFEVEPGVVALDIRDGPAPPDAPHEAVLDVPVAAAPPTALAPSAAPRPDNPLADAWIARSLGQTGGPVPADGASDPVGRPAANLAPVPSLPPAPSAEPLSPAFDPAPTASAPLLAGLPDPVLQPLRESLMHELSRGAARGVVQMAMPEDLAGIAPSARDPVQARLGLGALPQVRVEAPAGAGPDLAAEGVTCPADDRLEMEGWGDDRPVWEQISEARTGLTGEFDRPDPEAVARAVRFHLYIGFGQEALSLMRAFETGSPDQPLWSSMAHLLDGMPDPAPAFAGLSACDGAAALWAVLGEEEGAGKPANFPAVQRAFSALPAPLRQELGPRLIDRLVAAGADAAVEVVANAIRRPGNAESRDLALMNAELAGNAGRFEEAEAHLRPLLQDPGPGTPEAMVALIEGHAQRALPLPPETLVAIDSFAAERIGGPDSPGFQRAQILAQALTGNPVSAFAEARGVGGVQADLWRLLSALGTDDDILTLAAIAPGDAPPAEASEVAQTLAERFLTLGLPDQAQRWLGGSQRLDRLLAARVALARRDGLSATVLLQGIESAEADELRLAALLLSGDDASIAAALRQGGRAEEADAVLARSGDWEALGQGAQPHWQAAASTMLPPVDTAPPEGSLAEGAALVARAAQTRAAVLSLLAAVPPAETVAP